VLFKSSVHLKNKGSLLTLMVPWRTFNMQGTFLGVKNIKKN